MRRCKKAAVLLSLMAIYLLSAALNLLHRKKRRGADYIVVLGSGVIGARVTPLLAAQSGRYYANFHSETFEISQGETNR